MLAKANTELVQAEEDRQKLELRLEEEWQRIHLQITAPTRETQPVDETRLLRDASIAIEQRNRTRASRLLYQVVRQNEGNEKAWLALSALVDDPNKEREYLLRVLAINPGNEIAQRHLARLNQQPLPPPRATLLEPPQQPTSMSLATCPHCGKPLRESASSCGFCGHSVKPDPAAQIVEAPSADRIRHAAKVPQLLILGTLGLAAIVVFGMVGILAFRRLVMPVSSAIPVASTAIVATPWDTSTPQTYAACQSAAVHYLDQIRPLVREFLDNAKVAGSTPRVALAPVIQNVQRIQRDIESITIPSCASSPGGLLIRGINGVADGYIDFLGDAPDVTVERKLNQGFADIENALLQLEALGAGRATPVPKEVPTRVPTRTPMPTPTPLQAGSSIVVDDWQIRVERIELAEQMASTVSDSRVKAQGRFALVFLRVTNRGLSPRTFVAIGKLEIQDASGRRYQEDSMASLYAQFKFDTDIGADINPDGTAHVVVAFDISQSSSFYVLVPGILADPYSPRVLLDMQ